jgi:putative transposase
MKIEYHNLYTHFVFITLDRQPLIPEKNRDRIEKYITGIVNNNSSKLYAIDTNSDQLHFIVSRSPSISEEQLATVVATSSERFINENNLANGQFAWQQSASAFSVSKVDVDKVCKYILNQAEHHKKMSLAEEYEQFIKFYQRTLKKKWGSKVSL